MKQLKTDTIIGILFVIITGTLSHFFYDWSGNSRIAGFVTPVNESVWEHMKLLFFPMLLYALFMIFRLREEYPLEKICCFWISGPSCLASLPPSGFPMGSPYPAD